MSVPVGMPMFSWLGHARMRAVLPAGTLALMLCFTGSGWGIADQNPRAAPGNATQNCVDRSASRTASPERPDEQRTPRIGSAGMRVHIDPQTGKFRSPPPAERGAPGVPSSRAAPRSRAATATSHEGLVQVPSRLPSGGVMVDLKGRFRSHLSATIGKDCEIKFQHGPATRQD